MPLKLNPYSKEFYTDSTEKLQVITVPTRSDNYTFLILNEEKTKAALVDSADHKVVPKTLRELNLELECILLTHHHFDHVEGLDVILSKHPHAKLYCSKKEAQRGVFSSPHTEVKEGDSIKLFGDSVKVMETPGHTVSHLSYCFTESKALFCGDTLFSLGCGRVFENEPGIFESYFNSFQALKKTVDKKSLVFCAHEYTEANLEFCETNNLTTPQARTELQNRLKNYNFERTVPSDFEFELNHNPFLKAESTQGLKNIRALKDNFT